METKILKEIDNFSLAELGYVITDFFNFSDFEVIRQSPDVESSHENPAKHEFFDDYKLFDLAEIMILFAKDEKRSGVINRLNLSIG